MKHFGSLKLYPTFYCIFVGTGKLSKQPLYKLMNWSNVTNETASKSIGPIKLSDKFNHFLKLLKAANSCLLNIAIRSTISISKEVVCIFIQSKGILFLWGPLREISWGQFEVSLVSFFRALQCPFDVQFITLQRPFDAPLKSLLRPLSRPLFGRYRKM